MICELFHQAIANVEKEIFLGPKASNGVHSLKNLYNGLPHLVASEHCRNCRAIRTVLNTSFHEGGEEHWIVIDGLKEGSRYEVRICWAATQPTAFDLKLYSLEEVEAHSPLLTKIQKHASAVALQDSINTHGSILLLRIKAKAAYVSSSKYRMENPEHF